MVVAIFAGMLLTSFASIGFTLLIRPAKPMPRKHRALLDDAMGLIARLRNPTDLDRVDLLSDPSQQAADRLLARYNKEFPE